jgi:PucR family transcriptional regulator, purine catabolism regulatory protein
MQRTAPAPTVEGLVGDLALAGRLQPAELESWLAPLGVGERSAVLAFSLRDPSSAVPALKESLQRAGAHGVVATHDELLCAVVDCTSANGEVSGRSASSPSAEAGSMQQSAPAPIELAARARRELGTRFGEVHASASRPAPTVELCHSFHEARFALSAVRRAGRNEPEVASHRDLGAFELLLSLQDEEALERYCESVLGPIAADEGEYGDELLRSLDVFIEHNGHWEHAARALYCHRHTLRYRIKRVEALTGRDFSRARDRIELWLALRGRELAR